MTHRYLRLAWWIYRLAPLVERLLPGRWLVPALSWADEVSGEREMAILPAWVSPDRLAVDVGAAEGSYTWRLTRLAAGCVAFEANPESAARVRARVRRATVHAVALSDRQGKTELRVPVSNGVPLTGWATIEPTNALAQFQDVKMINVPLRTLDSFALPRVGFIKIDVEHHELSVLCGAEALIRRDHPILLIELNGGTKETVCRWLRERGYSSPKALASGRNFLFFPEPATLC